MAPAERARRHEARIARQLARFLRDGRKNRIEAAANSLALLARLDPVRAGQLATLPALVVFWDRRIRLLETFYATIRNRT